MAVTPSTNLYLLKVPLEIDNKNQLTFTNKESQFDYFANLDAIVVDNFTYQRKDSVIRYPAHIDSIIEYNYCMYQNENYSTKWFYAYITNMRYINDNMTEITIETDVFQTWQFDIIYNKMFVEREHVNDDSIGMHTVPESLETGEYISKESFNYGLGDTCVVIASTIDFFKFDSEWSIKFPNSTIHNGIFSGIQYFIFKDPNYSSNVWYDSAGYFLQSAAYHGQVDAIQSIFLVPKKMVDYDNISWDSPETGLLYHFYKKLPHSLTAFDFDNLSINKNYGAFGGSYYPKNNKLFTYPYNFFMIDNNSGTATQYNYEDFSTNSCVFNVKGAISPGCSIKAVPQNYKGVTNNENENIIAGKFPVCNYVVDSYTNWLTQNSININGTNIPTGFVTASGQALVGLATGNINTSALSTVTSTLKTLYEHSFMSPQTGGNLNSGDVNYASGSLDFIVYNRSIKPEYAKIIDDFFSMFGYKVNSLKIPNITGRRNWNFIKTIDCNIHADIPQTDIQTLKDMFNNGVTFWHNPVTFLDYSQNNDII